MDPSKGDSNSVLQPRCLPLVGHHLLDFVAQLLIKIVLQSTKHKGWPFTKSYDRLESQSRTIVFQERVHTLVVFNGCFVLSWLHAWLQES